MTSSTCSADPSASVLLERRAGRGAACVARSLLFIVAAFSAAAVTSCGSDDGGEGVSDEEQTYADSVGGDPF